MAIRDTWNRIVRKSVRSSTSSSGGRSDDGHTDPTTAATPTPTKPLSRPGLSKNSSWRSNHNANNTTTTNNHNHNHNHNNNGPKEKGQHASSPPPSKPLLMHRPLSFFRPNHPMYRQMTEQNLQYQEALSTYTMQFGRSRPPSRGALSDFSDISPCHSRAGSLDYGGCGSDGLVVGPRRRSSSLGPKDEER